MPLPDTESDTPPVPRGRQRPGAACDECRRRKLRCDGQHPQCGVCRETDVVCEVTQRGTRGPKKGHLKALKNRIVHLEAMLETRLPPQPRQPYKPYQAHQRSDLLGNSHSNDDNDGRTVSSGSEHETFISNGYGLQGLHIDSNLVALPSEPDSSFASAVPLSEVMQAELYPFPPDPVTSKYSAANNSPSETSSTWTACINRSQFSTKDATCHGPSPTPGRHPNDACSMPCGHWHRCFPLTPGI